MGLEIDGGLKIYLRDVKKTPLLTRKEEIELAAKIKKGSNFARTSMIKANLRLVIKIAQDYSHYGLDLEDLISEGNIGLMKAVDRFDPKKGGKLSTYGAWWIKQSIRRALADKSRTIRLPVHTVEKIGKMLRVAMRLAEEYGREPSDKELADELGMEEGKVAFLMANTIRPASLDAPINNDEDNDTFGEVIADEKAKSPLEMLTGKNIYHELDGLIDTLDKREQQIIIRRFGLRGVKKHTLKEVSNCDDIDVGSERVRQIEEIIKEKLRNALRTRENTNISRAKHKTAAEKEAENQKPKETKSNNPELSVCKFPVRNESTSNSSTSINNVNGKLRSRKRFPRNKRMRKAKKTA